MRSFNIGFINRNNEEDETQLDTEYQSDMYVLADIVDCLHSLWDELEIKEVTYIEEV